MTFIFRPVRVAAVVCVAVLFNAGVASGQQPDLPVNPGPQTRPPAPAQPPVQAQPQQPQPQQPQQPPQAQQPRIVNGYTGAFLREAADVFFDQAELRTTSNGLPVVVARQGNNTYVLAGQNCNSRGAQPVCRALTMVSIYRGPYERNTLLLLNQFAQQSIFGAGYLDNDSDLILKYSFRMSGVTLDYVRDNFVLFRDVIVSSFRERVVRSAPRAQASGQPIVFEGEGAEPSGLDPAAAAERREWKRFHAEAVADRTVEPLDLLALPEL